MNKWVRYGITFAVIAVVAYFFGKSLVRNWSALQNVDFSFSGWIVLGIVLFAMAVVISGLLWGKMVTELSGERLTYLESIRVHCLSWLLKYIPGQVGSVANKIAWASTRGVPKSLVSLTFVYENVFLVVGSLVPPTIILFLYGAVDLTGSTALLAALIAVVPLVVLTNKRVFAWAVNLLSVKILKRPVSSEYFLSSMQTFRYQLWYLIPRIVNGAGVVVIGASMVSIDPGAFLPIACAYIIAGAVGILAVFVPSGIGVRESVFVLLVMPFVSTQEAIVLSLASRLWATVADILVGLIYLVLKVYSQRSAAGNSKLEGEQK